MQPLRYCKSSGWRRQRDCYARIYAEDTAQGSWYLDVDVQHVDDVYTSCSMQKPVPRPPLGYRPGDEPPSITNSECLDSACRTMWKCIKSLSSQWIIDLKPNPKTHISVYSIVDSTAEWPRKLPCRSKFEPLSCNRYDGRAQHTAMGSATVAFPNTGPIQPVFSAKSCIQLGIKWAQKSERPKFE